MKLVDKDAVAVEVERRIKETESMQPKFDQFWAGQISAFKGVLKILDTLEVKEADSKDTFIERACDAYCKVCGHYPRGKLTHICRQECDYYKDFQIYIKGK